mmetsp:Transcript_68127/g.107023  ORF Transcript_68127/g.107023 Transcript_68127/m.107023 type:complete len:201 (+) Transcript_68127:443-1045(+)
METNSACTRRRELCVFSPSGKLSLISLSKSASKSLMLIAPLTIARAASKCDISCSAARALVKISSMPSRSECSAFARTPLKALESDKPMALLIWFSSNARRYVLEAWRRSCDILSLAASFIFVGKSFSTWVLLLVKETLISSCTLAFCLASKRVCKAPERTSATSFSKSVFFPSLLSSSLHFDRAASSCFTSSVFAARVS